MPVFVQFQQDQEIMKTGEGSLFIIYEDDGVHYSGAEDEDDVEDNYGPVIVIMAPVIVLIIGLSWCWWSPIINASFYASIYASFWCAFYV